MEQLIKIFKLNGIEGLENTLKSMNQSEVYELLKNCVINQSETNANKDKTIKSSESATFSAIGSNNLHLIRAGEGSLGIESPFNPSNQNQRPRHNSITQNIQEQYNNLERGSNAYVPPKIPDFHSLFQASGDTLQFNIDSPNMRAGIIENAQALDDLRNLMRNIVAKSRTYCEEGIVNTEHGRALFQCLRDLRQEQWEDRLGAIATLMAQIGDSLIQLEDYREGLMSAIESTFREPMEEFVEREIDTIKQLKQQHTMERFSYESLLEKYLGKKNNIELESQVIEARAAFEKSRFDLIAELNSLSMRKKFQLCDRMCSMLYGCLGFYHNSHTTLAVIEPAIRDLANATSKARRFFAREELLKAGKRAQLCRDLDRNAGHWERAHTLQTFDIFHSTTDSADIHENSDFYVSDSEDRQDALYGRDSNSSNESNNTSLAKRSGSNSPSRKVNRRGSSKYSYARSALQLDNADGMYNNNNHSSQDRDFLFERGGSYMNVIANAGRDMRFRKMRIRDKRLSKHQLNTSKGRNASSSMESNISIEDNDTNDSKGKSNGGYSMDIGSIPDHSDRHSKITKAGYLYKRSRRGVFQRRWFVLLGDQLLYRRDPHPNADINTTLFYSQPSKDRYDELIKVSDMLVSSVKKSVDHNRPHMFELINPSQDHGHYFLQAESDQDLKEWLKALQSAISTSLRESMDRVSFSPDAKAKGESMDSANSGTGSNHGVDTDTHKRSLQAQRQEQLTAAEIDEIKAVEGNTLCADCEMKRPSWAVLNLGALVCIECSGVHRSLGSHVSRVRSLELDLWTSFEIELLKRIGNYNVNSIYTDKTNPESRKLSIKATRAERMDYIKNKYEYKRYVAISDTNSNEYLLHESAEKGDAVGILKSLARGADVNCTSGSEFVTPLISAVKVGDAVCTQLLCLHNATVDKASSTGKFPLDFAELLSHNQNSDYILNVLVQKLQSDIMNPVSIADR